MIDTKRLDVVYDEQQFTLRGVTTPALYDLTGLTSLSGTWLAPYLQTVHPELAADPEMLVRAATTFMQGGMVDVHASTRYRQHDEAMMHAERRIVIERELDGGLALRSAIVDEAHI